MDQAIYQLKINIAKNAILCVLKGRFDPAGARKYVKKFKEGVDKLKPGLIVTTDSSEFIPGTDEVRLIFSARAQNMP